jgi:hypothetical protein
VIELTRVPIPGTARRLQVDESGRDRSGHQAGSQALQDARDEQPGQAIGDDECHHRSHLDRDGGKDDGLAADGIRQRTGGQQRRQQCDRVHREDRREQGREKDHCCAYTAYKGEGALAAARNTANVTATSQKSRERDG